jgi:hypothetical protein
MTNQNPIKRSAGISTNWKKNKMGNKVRTLAPGKRIK